MKNIIKYSWFYLWNESFNFLIKRNYTILIADVFLSKHTSKIRNSCDALFCNKMALSKEPWASDYKDARDNNDTITCCFPIKIGEANGMPSLPNGPTQVALRGNVGSLDAPMASQLFTIRPREQGIALRGS